LQVFPWPSISTQEASVKTLRLLEGPFSAQIDRGDLKRATQLAIGVLKSLELQESPIVSKEDTSQAGITFKHASFFSITPEINYLRALKVKPYKFKLCYFFRLRR